MSHLAQRKEKNCLNCDTIVVGKYCHNCGQENVEPKESAWQLITHFFNDITHFDGKFFSTLKVLLFKPGLLSREYMNGRRASFLNPIRMYLFTSFIFFLAFFSTIHVNEKGLQDKDLVKGKTMEQIQQMNDTDFEKFSKSVTHGKTMSREQFKLYVDSLNNSKGLNFLESNYKSKAQYDSAVVSTKIKNSWFKDKMIKKQIQLNEKYGNDPRKISTSLIENLMHHFPQMLFISLPFLAWFLKLLYVRRNEFYFVSHVIFVLNFYIFVFIAMLFSLGISELHKLSGWEWMNYINGVISLVVFFYLYKAMRNFYRQRRFKTIVKYFLLLFSFLLITILLFGIFFFVSFFQV